VGGEIARQLLSAGHNLHFIVRDVSSARARAVEQGFCGQAHAGDVLDAASPERVCAGMDAGIHLVGTISEVGESTFDNIHMRGTQNILAAAQKAGTKSFSHMSALGTQPDAVSRYHQSKWAAEQIVRGSGLDYTIFRPSLIFGPQDQFVNVFAKIIRLSPFLPVMGNDTAKFQPVSIAVVAAAFVRSLSEPKSIGRTYDLCGPETFTLPEILDEILRAMGRKRLKFRVPLALARWQAAFLEFVFPRLLRKAPPLNRNQLIKLQEGNVGNAQPVNELFGLKQTSFREGVARNLQA